MGHDSNNVTLAMFTIFTKNCVELLYFTLFTVALLTVLVHSEISHMRYTGHLEDHWLSVRYGP